MKVPLFKICRKEGRGKNFDEDYHWCTKIDPVQSFVPKFSILCETVHTRVHTWYVCSQGYILGTCVYKLLLGTCALQLNCLTKIPNASAVVVAE